MVGTPEEYINELQIQPTSIGTWQHGTKNVDIPDNGESATSLRVFVGGRNPGVEGNITLLFDDIKLYPNTTTPKCLLDRCEGNCNTDDDCLGDLKCFVRNHFEPVPGCSGLGEKGRDYCYDTTHLNQECVFDPLSGCSRNGFSENDEGLSWWWSPAVTQVGGDNKTCVDSIGRSYKRYIFYEKTLETCVSICAKHEECRILLPSYLQIPR